MVEAKGRRAETLNDRPPIETSARRGPRRFGRVVGGTDAMLDIFCQLERWAPTDYSVLITGETGTGKDLVAEAIHKASPRRGGPFVAINCLEFPKAFVERGLFGYVRGAFMGAETDDLGVFGEAEGGTLFLDHVGDYSMDLQATLLPVLQSKEVRPIGGKPRPINLRTIFATNKDLDSARHDGSFREDLFDCIAKIRVELPPLRQRLDDLPLLLADICKEHGREEVIFEGGTLAELRSLLWRGNVRELRTVIGKVLVCVPRPRTRVLLEDLEFVLCQHRERSGVFSILPKRSGSAP